jgi:methylenetetrahydrofolate dehydrogenase (NADP+)/methenyltetrahydrofolate cyclohydrolase
MTLIERYAIDIESKKCVVIGSSRNVGGAIAQMLVQREDVTVTVCNSKTKNLKSITIDADLIISAVGIPNLVTEDMVKEGVSIIDVGISRVEDSSKKSGYKIVGDVDFENIYNKANLITPVPGGVGPMTIVSLLQNTLKVYCDKFKI